MNKSPYTKKMLLHILVFIKQELTKHLSSTQPTAEFFSVFETFEFIELLKEFLFSRFNRFCLADDIDFIDSVV